MELIAVIEIRVFSRRIPYSPSTVFLALKIYIRVIQFTLILKESVTTPCGCGSVYSLSASQLSGSLGGLMTQVSVSLDRIPPAEQTVFTIGLAPFPSVACQLKCFFFV